MFNKLFELFQETNGSMSNTRMNTTLAAFAAVFLSVFTVYQAMVYSKVISIEVIGLIGTLFTYAGLTKTISKKLENGTTNGVEEKK